MNPDHFTYSNRNERGAGRIVSIAGRVLPGVARVHAEAAAFATEWERSNRAALRATGPLWVALGDSLTLGAGASAFDRGWVGQLHARLDPRWRVVNLAVSGATTADVLERQVPMLARLDPALVTVMVGSNDLMRSGHRRGLAERIDRIATALPPGAIIATLPNPSRAATAASARLVELAAERDLVVAELRDRRTASWRGKLAADHFHPNERGYAAIADVLADTVLPRTARRN